MALACSNVILISKSKKRQTEPPPSHFEVNDTTPAMKFISAIAAVLLALPFTAAQGEQCQRSSQAVCCDTLVQAYDGSLAGRKLVI